jgi:hypothetical protein
MDYKYLNKFIDMGVEKAVRHHTFNNDKIDWYILLRRVRIQSVLKGRIRIRSKTGPDPQYCLELNIIFHEMTPRGLFVDFV